MTYLFLDLSNFVFQRYHGITAWMKHSGTDFNDNPSGKMDMFKRLFKEHLVKLKKKFKVDWDHFYIARDCSREHIWRVQHYPEYKACRTCANFDPEAFRVTYAELLPEMMALYKGITVLQHPRAEADDVIAIAVEMLKERGCRQKVVVISNDNDYIQLLGKGYQGELLILNGSLKDITERVKTDSIGMYLEHKIIRGDTSDNIPPIKSKIGEKIALKYANEPKELEKLLDAHPDAKKQYDLNRLLIDFDSIPEDIKRDVKDAYRNYLC